jgi:hypothetical protein
LLDAIGAHFASRHHIAHRHARPPPRGDGIRDDLRAQIQRMSGESRALSSAMGRSRRVLPGGRAPMDAQTTLRTEMGSTVAPPLRPNSATRGMIGELAAQPTLSAQDLAKLKQLRDTYSDLDQGFLDALKSLYAARARALMVS